MQKLFSAWSDWKKKPAIKLVSTEELREKSFLRQLMKCSPFKIVRFAFFQKLFYVLCDRSDLLEQGMFIWDVKFILDNQVATLGIRT